jgi:NAD(P)-dependent dehydrogenase (short-subunit alcohol dehydrogenase family)
MDLTGRTYVVTGANSGVGRATTERLAADGAAVALVCRSRERGERALREIEERTGNTELALRVADLASLGQVRRLGEELATDLARLDGLINNAGVYRARREPTEEGLEMTMAVNHLAHYLLTHHVFEPLRSAGGRVVNVSSGSHRTGDLRRAPLESIVRGEIRYRGYQAYSDSKLANVLFTRELDRRARSTGVTTHAVHPGMLATRIWNQNRNLGSLLARLFKPFMGSPEKGGAAVARVATDPALDGVSGRYFDRMDEAEPAPQARDAGLARELWELSAELVGVDPAWPDAASP